jgi:serine/threonine protein kinase
MPVKYKLIEKISEGMFGQVFKGENIRTHDKVAIKVEFITGEIKTLKNEAKIYHYLSSLDGFPRLKWYGKINDLNYLVIDLLGTNLTNIILHYKVLSLRTTLILGIQIIQRIQSLHNHFLLHRDIKTDNFLFGIRENTNKVFLIDFGFAKRYQYNGVHIDPKSINSVIGSVNFVSLNVHGGIEPTRRDDLESCIYIILNMLVGKLEWFEQSDINTIIKMKKELLNQEDVPPFIKIMLHYIRDMNYDDSPDYQYLINLMNKVFNDHGFTKDNKYEWQ